MTFGFGALEAEFWRLAFVMTRIGAAMLAAPFFGSANVPPQLRVILTGGVAVLVCAWTPVAAPAALLSPAGILALLGELLIGLSMGFVLQLTFAAPTIAAEVIGGTMGMSMASTVDPHSGAHSPALGQYFAVLLTVVFLGVGGHLQWMALLVKSYAVFPPGHVLGAAGFGAERMAQIVGFGAGMFTAAVTIALPITLVLILVQVLAGVLSRSAPALNLFSLGLPAGILAGIAALIASFPLLTDQMTNLSSTAITTVEQVIAR